MRKIKHTINSYVESFLLFVLKIEIPGIFLVGYKSWQSTSDKYTRVPLYFFWLLKTYQSSDFQDHPTHTHTKQNRNLGRTVSGEL